jgi:prolipoprotein diacylglyceryl transferase
LYPRISDLTKDLFGFELPLPIQSFGFMMAMGFITAYFIIYYELKRKAKLGTFPSFEITHTTEGEPSRTDIIINLILGAILGYKLGYVFMNYTVFNANPQQILLSTEGSFGGLFLGILIMGAYKGYEYYKYKGIKPKKEKKQAYPHDLMGNVIFIAAVSGILGAKLFAVLETWDDFIKHPLQSLLAFDGLTYYGGLILGAASVIYYIRRYKIPVLPYLDAAAPGLMATYGVGRIGCHVSGDGDWGIQVGDGTASCLTNKPAFFKIFPDWFYAYNYPNNVLGETPGYVYPTPLWEAILGIGLGIALLVIGRKLKLHHGVLFCIYLIVNGIERFLIEKIRVNIPYNIFGLKITQAEILSFLLILTGIAGWIWIHKKQKMTK